MSKANESGLAGKIKGLRLKLGLTQEQFAARVGVTFSTVNRWENDRGKPSPLAMRPIEDLCKQLDEKE
jgi:DNA-binding transcriptional regulator YiaG